MLSTTSQSGYKDQYESLTVFLPHRPAIVRSPANMNLTAVVEQRLEHGRTTAAGPYIELVDLGEVDQLSDAYLSLNDRKYGPEEQPPPLTSEEFKRYVRLAHDAIRSTDEAIDAFKEEKDGTMGKTSAMNYIDGLKMFEVQLVVGKLVKAVHKVHSGTITTPSWPMITALKFHKFQTFPDRMDKVIVALRTWKSLGKALFLDMVSMEKRLAMQPGEEIKKKGLNKSNNGNRDVQLQFARSNMPKAKKPATPANNDDDDEDDADNDGTPAPAIKKRRRATADAVIINPDARRGNNRGKKKKPVTQPTAPAASVSTNPSESVQPASSAASASSKTAVSGQPSNATRTAFTPINRRPLSQPAEPSIPAPNAGSPVGEAPSTSVDMRIGDPGQDATPTALRGDGFSQPTIFACHASADQQAAMDLLLSDKQAATKGLDDKFKFPRPLGKPSPKDGNQLPVPQTAAPWPGAHQDPLPSSQWLLPSQPQQARPPCLYSYPSQPPPDYATSQRASASFWQGTPRRDNPFPQASQQNQMQATRRNAPQRPFDRQPPSHNDANEDDIQRQGTTHYGQQTTTFGSLQNEGQVTKVHFQKNGRIIHNPMVGMRQEHSGPGAVSVSGTGVVSIHNYFQRRMPGALASTSDRNDPARGNYSGWHSFQSLDDNEGTLNVSASDLRASCMES